KDRLIAMQCRVIFFVPKPGQPDQSLAAPWDKLYRRAFLEKNHLRFPAKLKVLDDMSFNFRTFGCAEKIGYLHRQLYHYCFNEQSVTHIFRPDRPAQDRKAFHYLRCCIDEQERREMQQDSHAWPGYRRRLIAAYVCRIMKSTAIEVRAWLSARLP
ncbi:MAG: hypothetical protein K6G16_06750, partial [Lachnospiraceae bacterium]|nr:hypothetical protein [Lachnospiraceae bacterium]